MSQKNATWKKVKLLIKQNNKWEEYKKFFPNRSTRGMFCFFQDILKDSQFTIEELYGLEILVLSEKLRETMFVNSYNLFAKGLDKYKKVNFAPFANYFFYTWQASRFYKDEKVKIENIFTRSNYNVKNEKKRDFFYEWLRSLRTLDPDFNRIILLIRKKGL